MADPKVADDDSTTQNVSATTATPNGQPGDPRDVGADAIEPKTRLRLQFAERIASTWSRFHDAVAEIQRAARAMESEGRPPSYRLVQTLGDCHREFHRLRHDLVGSSRALSIPLPSTDELVGIDSLARWLDLPHSCRPDPAPQTSVFEDQPVDMPPPDLRTPDVVSVAECWQTPELEPSRLPEPPIVPKPEAPIEEPSVEVEHPHETTRRAALGVIETILRLRIRDGTEFPPLDECQSQAHSLRERIATSPASDLPAEANDLVRGEHPLAELLTVVGGIESLSDTQWADVHASVTQAFGRPLAVAAARGRLVVGPTIPSS